MNAGSLHRCRIVLASIAALGCAVLSHSQVAQAKQICTMQTVDNDDFEGVSGSGDNNVIAVGKKGNIARFDGLTWTPMVSPTNEELRDVHVISSGAAFAVGKDGEILQLNGAVWTRHTGVTNEDLRGVWAASATEVWVGGKKGTLFFYDGSIWTDVSAPAGTSNRDIEDAWGDAASFYAVDDRGTLYRYDRDGGFWDAPDTACAAASSTEDLWGDASGNLFLVSKKNVYLYDGASCTLLANANEDLRGISGSAATGEVYAVGKKGEVMYYNGAAWQQTTEGNQELNDDWVSAAGNAYYAGKKGQVTVCQKVIPQLVGDWPMDDCSLDFPGSAVLDAGGNGLDGVTSGGVSLQTTGQLCPAAGLDGSTGYIAVADAPLLDLVEGISFAVWVRHNTGVLGAWETVMAKGDSAYRLHLNGGCTIADTLPGNIPLGFTFGLNGGCGGADLNSNVVPTPGVWYHVAGTYDRNRMYIYINGTLVNSANYTAPINTNNFNLVIGENPQNPGRHWNGDIDEFTLWDEAITAAEVLAHRDRTRPCGNCSIAEFVVGHDNNGIHCLDETIRVDVIDSLAGTPRTDYNAQVTLDTQNGGGSWMLISGGGAFTDATAGDGLATYDWPLGESFAVFTLDYPSGPAAMDIDVFDTLDPTVRDQDGEGPLVFSASGFTLTAAPLSNPPPAVIAPFAGPHVAGTDMPLHLTAFGQTPSHPQCGVIETYTGARNLKFWSSYLNPGTGTVNLSIDGVGVAGSEAAAALMPVSFVNGQAAVTAKYKDVGLIQAQVKDDTVAHPDLPNGIRGATAGFVVTPDHFELLSIEDGAGNPNPATAGSAGPAFIAAGQPFSVTVTSVDAEGDPTPNYGRENVAETVTLTATLVAPAAGNNAPLAAPLGFGAFAAGTATGTDFSWPEVGVITLTPLVGDGSYLTAGNVTGQASGNVGRFVPAYFDVTRNAPALSTACGSGGFTYLGQSFAYAVAPQITATARAAGGAVTQNYTGAFFKIDNASLLNRTYTAAAGNLDTTGLPAAGVDPAIADLAGGVSSLTFSTGAGLTFTRSVPAAPFDADIQLSIELNDSDGVAAMVNPVVFGSPGGITFDAGAQMRFGRAQLGNAIGSELVNLPLPLTTQYFVDAATGFATHVADNCTGAVPLTLGAFAGALTAADTCVLDAGSPGASNAGCAVTAPPGQQYRAPPLGGDFNLFLAAPGAGKGGRVTVTADAPQWLEFDWDASLPGLEDPAGTATFGIYSGQARRIYLREIY